jgi:hypothetical protein
MSCDIARFTITRGVENIFVFTIKANGSTLPMVIDPADTFQAAILPLDPLDVSGPLIDKALVATDLANGQVTLTITETESNTAITSLGSKTDRYYSRPMYKLVIDCVTLNNGKFIAKVPEIYVD